MTISADNQNVNMQRKMGKKVLILIKLKRKMHKKELFLLKWRMAIGDVKIRKLMDIAYEMGKNIKIISLKSKEEIEKWDLTCIYQQELYLEQEY